MLGQNDNASVGGEYRPSRFALFLPTAVIGAGYGTLLTALALGGRSDTTAFRFCVAVLALCLPFLFAHALLRALTIRVRLLPHAAFVHRGFPSIGAVEIPYDGISRLRIVRGFGGRLTGGGTLLIDAGGGRVAVCDLADPEAARDAIAARMDVTATAAGTKIDAAPPGRTVRANVG